MMRAKITETTVSYKTYSGGKVGYIRISSFKSNTDDQFVDAVNALELIGVEAIIFDLRNNGGGYLNSVCNMLSYLVPTNTEIASFSNSKEPIYATDGKGSEHEAEGDHVLTVPAIVLCNEYSASASELFTAAMRDYNTMGLLSCTVMGKTTFKKGIMQSTLTFTDGSTLTLTTALYNPPSGTNFHGVGVAPDITLADGADYITEALRQLGY
jgi:carboxyl-terminal processing protease